MLEIIFLVCLAAKPDVCHEEKPDFDQQISMGRMHDQGTGLCRAVGW